MYDTIYYQLQLLWCELNVTYVQSLHISRETRDDKYKTDKIAKRRLLYLSAAKSGRLSPF